MNRKKVWWLWGGLDAIYVIWYFLNSLLGGRVPFFSDIASAVNIFPDHGSRYITKVYSDQWMEEQGFINNCVHNYDEVFKTEIIK